MALPNMNEIELPLLREIEAIGGEAKPHDIYPRVTIHFPQITEDDLKETIASGSSKWTNRIQWVRQRLVLKRELARYPRGMWRITEKGRGRLKVEGLLKEGEPRPVQRPTTKQPTRHEDLKQKMVDIGRNLSYYISTEESAYYRHDVLWRQGKYQSPSHVIEICEGGSLTKDFDALHWANDLKNWGAKGILVVADDKDFEKASRRFEGQPGLTAVKAEMVDNFHKMVDDNLQFLQFIFNQED